MSTATGHGPWEQSNREEAADLAALERALTMPAEQRETAVAVLNSRRRRASYSDGSTYQPLHLPDGWGAPRWQQADNITGGTEPRRLVDRLPSGSLLDRVPGGPCLEPPAPRPKKEKAAVLRCSRCGCIASPNNTILRGGWPWCRVCCGGHNPTALPIDDSGASPPAQ